MKPLDVEFREGCKNSHAMKMKSSQMYGPPSWHVRVCDCAHVCIRMPF